MLSRTRWKCRAAALAGALAIVTVPAAAHGNTAALATPNDATAAAAGGWNDTDCAPAPDHPRPAVLVHGTFGNKTTNWVGLAPYLANRGYCVYSLDYGALDGIPVFRGLGPIEDSAVELAEFVDEVLNTTGATEVDLVGHSQGGMMPRHYLKHDPEAAGKVNALVALAPSTNGTTLSGIAHLVDLFPGAGDLLEDLAPALRQQVVGSDFLTELNADGYTVPGVSYTVIGTRYDLVVTPHETAFINEPGVTNVLTQDLCPLNISGHLGVALTDRHAFHEVTNALDPENATPTTCLSVLD